MLRIFKIKDSIIILLCRCNLCVVGGRSSLRLLNYLSN